MRGFFFTRFYSDLRTIFDPPITSTRSSFSFFTFPLISWELSLRSPCMELDTAWLKCSFESGNGPVLSPSVPTSVLHPRTLSHCQEVFPPGSDEPPEAKLSGPHLFIISELFFPPKMCLLKNRWGMSGFPAYRFPINTHTNTQSWTYMCEL